MVQLGPFRIENPVWLAPMAGITDLPFRLLCRELGAGHAISEMQSSNPRLRNSAKSQARMRHQGEPAPIHVQIAGSEPEEMAAAAVFNVAQGADIIDINMGCPAKKVCRKLAGSSLLQNEGLVAAILEAVVSAVDVPVTLKTRTGWCRESRNAVRIGRLAEQLGISCITLHGRTRNDFYKGEAEFDTFRRLRDAVSIPLVANGDIRDAETAARILEECGADAVMIGRAAQARPWLPGTCARRITGGEPEREPDLTTKRDILLRLVESLHRFYGADGGCRMARKHIVAQIEALNPPRDLRQSILKAPEPGLQMHLLKTLFDDHRISLAA